MIFSKKKEKDCELRFTNNIFQQILVEAYKKNLDFESNVK